MLLRERIYRANLESESVLTAVVTCTDPLRQVRCDSAEYISNTPLGDGSEKITENPGATERGAGKRSCREAW